MNEHSPTTPTVLVSDAGRVRTVIINRPDSRNAVDRPTAQALADAFRDFDSNGSLDVAVLAGEGGNFCAGADLKAFARGEGNRLEGTGDAPMGPSRMHLRKPVIAAVSGYAVAGGLELAIWCDLRVVEQSAVFGVFCRRWGVPLIDGGTVRLPRIVGLGVAMDMIMTGREVSADEALRIGLANRVVAEGDALRASQELAAEISNLPQECMRNDRQSVFEAFGLPEQEALRAEWAWGQKSLDSGALDGATRFADGHGRHGEKAP